MKPDAIAKLSLPELKRRCTQTAHEIRDAVKVIDSKLMVAGDLIHQVQQRMAWEKWGFPNFTAWSEWFQEESGMSHGRFYAVLSTRQALGQYNGGVLERLGSTKAYQLSRLAKKKPKMLKQAMEMVLRTPDITTHEVEQKVDTMIAGGSLTTERFRLVKFLIPYEDVSTLDQTFAVMQFSDPVDVNNEEIQKGLHLVALCMEKQTDEKYIKAARELERAGSEVFVVES